MNTSKKKPAESQQESRVVGIRVPIDVARSFKAEAAQRGMKLNDLFEEMWASYKKSHKKAD